MSAAGVHPSAVHRRTPTSLRNRLRTDWQMLVPMIPGALCLLLFFYVPILGNIIAFQECYPFITIPEARCSSRSLSSSRYSSTRG